MSFTDDDNFESKGGEKIWTEFGFFGKQRAELTIPKANFPENSLIYVNQATVSLVKGGEKTIYCDNVICAQIMPMANLIQQLILILTSLKMMRSCCFVLCITQAMVYIAV